jgi:antitoxin MazE
METSIQKWGNGLGVRLPKQLAQKRSLRAGTKVLVTETSTGVSIEVLEKKPPSLADLVKRISPSNLHTETDWGGSVGNEVW